MLRNIGKSIVERQERSATQSLAMRNWAVSADFAYY